MLPFCLSSTTLVVSFSVLFFLFCFLSMLLPFSLFPIVFAFLIFLYFNFPLYSLFIYFFSSCLHSFLSCPVTCFSLHLSNSFSHSVFYLPNLFLPWIVSLFLVPLSFIPFLSLSLCLFLSSFATSSFFRFFQQAFQCSVLQLVWVIIPFSGGSPTLQRLPCSSSVPSSLGLYCCLADGACFYLDGKLCKFLNPHPCLLALINPISSAHCW
jgi:hypothetical protein